MLPRNRRILFLSLTLGFACAVQAARFRAVRDVALVMDYVDQLYVEPIERRSLGYRAIAGILDALDPYSGFISPSQMSVFRSQIEQSFAGLGIVIAKDETGLIVVEQTIPGGPAVEAGIRAGDRISTIDGVPTQGLDLPSASQLLRGIAGTSVVLSTLPAGSDTPREVRITRDLVETPSVAGDHRDQSGHLVYALQADPRIAYIHLSIFGEHSTREVRTFLQHHAAEASAVVIDLRANSGGLLETAKEICDMFLDGGTIVSIEGRLPEERTVISATPGTLLDPAKPLVLIIDGDSASASEVVAACLQDSGRAKVAGSRSYGKGSVQTVIELDGGRAALRLTTANWYSPNRRRISRPPVGDPRTEWGVDPDEELAVELSDSQRLTAFQRLRRRDSGNLSPGQSAEQGNGGSSRPADDTTSEGEALDVPFDLSSLADEATLQRLLAADPSLAEDPQLLRVVAWLQQQLKQ